MSQAPHLLPGSRTNANYRFGHLQLQDSLLQDGLTCAMGHVPMGITAENIADRYQIEREEQDRFAVESQRRAQQAIAQRRFAEEIVPIACPGKRGESITVAVDEHPRSGVTLESLAKLKPAFKDGGTVTAGNASGINDGAAAVVLCSMDKAKELGFIPLARIRSYASAGVDPAYMGTGPIPAIQLALRRAGMQMRDVGLIELNEAFAAQALCVMQSLQLDPSLVNVNGGAIALGHPIGASGARILVTLLYEMKRRGTEVGLAALCVGGGQGAAMIVEQLDGFN